MSGKVQPEVEIVISAAAQLLFNATIKSNETFRIITQSPGIHQICFRDTSPETQSYQQSADVFFELNPVEIPQQSEDKVVTANYILREAKETSLDQQYAKQRISELIQVAKSVKFNVLLVGIIAIIVSWGIVIAQN